MLDRLRRYAARKLWASIDIDGPTLREWWWHQVLHTLYGRRPHNPKKETP